MTINNIQRDKLESILYDSIILSIFMAIHSYIIRSDTSPKLKRALLSSGSVNEELIHIENVVKKITKLELTKKELLTLRKLILAYITKHNTRGIIPIIVKQDLLSQQKHLCSLCADTINIENMHTDHIIPFFYVGDELPNNYQGLCLNCNTKKNSNPLEIFTRILNKTL